MTRGRVKGFIEVSRESIQKRCPGPQGKKARGAAAPCAALATMPWFPGQRFQAQTATMMMSMICQLTRETIRERLVAIFVVVRRRRSRRRDVKRNGDLGCSP